mmetsp:Transcript_51933/g.52908  ORF Transcript_51933/g.52908 Transcript_51933/m.52908 type:complete len:449 (+) Transcript_51933:44-1390(+)
MKDEPTAKRRQIILKTAVGNQDNNVSTIVETDSSSIEHQQQQSLSSSSPTITKESMEGKVIPTPHGDNDNLPTTNVIAHKTNASITNMTKQETATKIFNNSSSDSKKGTNVEEEAEAEVDRTSKDYYFDSYAHHAIHEEMLKDEVRTRTYEMAIKHNAHLFRNKIVLDVGAGTGILSMFASQAGAKHVYAVDCSSIAEQARQIVQKNGFGPDKITVIQGKIEEIELPVLEVDVIVSEWMGYFLLYESMLDTVIYARDKWLVKDGTGVVFPDKAVMYICAVEDGQIKKDRIDFWNNVYGFDMTPIQKIALQEPVVDIVDSKAVVSDAVPILHLDILTCRKEDVEFAADFKLTANRNDYIHGLVAYFECAFTQVHKPIGFSTSPFCRYTHWKQTIFYLPENLVICDKEKITGHITCKPNRKNRRDLDIGISILVDGEHSKSSFSVDYRLR